MKKTPDSNHETNDDLQAEYQLDYSKARSNRFAPKIPEGGRLVILDPDIAQVFTTPEAVNAVLRALIATMPKTNANDKAA
ncbi:hypothetical protein SE17_25965 [Kouleothrix aurantiaca]|jgi:hypothetical protein|uniref:Uncharacterized protein n=1 Tax=Kouleothrix aurantiaca TaxID=186479 RepID=A0A0P9DD65_9CHLR|nr:hypothetical protein SE17_25965 [Kouleothrix aurantiaca]